jgi:glycosyltransferase involved in cell wall biosynthesis
MNIGIDLRPLAVGASGGIAMVLKGVLERLFDSRPEDTFHVFCTIYSRQLIESSAANVRYESLPTRDFFPRMDGLIRQRGIEVLLRAFPISDDLQFPISRQVVLVPDLQHEERPEFFDSGLLRARRAAFGRVLAGAGAIGTISHHARRTILNFAGTRCRDVFLMPPALTVEHRPVSESELTQAERDLIPAGPYFYYPANLWPHKNHRKTLSAFEQFLQRCPDSQMQLLFSGHPAGWTRLRREFHHLPIRHLGFVRPELVRMLYQKATALCFFSQYEGFGIPLLEAFDAGTAVICSNTTSLPEVGGDAVLSCDPSDVRAMAMLMEKIQGEPELRRSLIEKGKIRLKQYTWQESADNLHAALGRVAKADVAVTASGPPADGAGIRRLYHQWYHEKGLSVGRVWRELPRRIRPLLCGSPAIHRMANRRPALARVLDRLNPVRGLWPDNWLSPDARIILNGASAGKRYQMMGHAAVNTELRIESEGRCLLAMSLKADQMRQIELTLDDPPARAITLRFTHHLTDPAGRRLAFHLEATNLFCEADTY